MIACFLTFYWKKIPCLLISIYKKNNNIKESVRFHGNLWQTWKFIRDPVFASFYKKSQQGLALALHRFASPTLNCFKKFLSTKRWCFCKFTKLHPISYYIKTVFCCNFCLTFADSWKFIENAKSEREFEWKIWKKTLTLAISGSFSSFVSSCLISSRSSII